MKDKPKPARSGKSRKWVRFCVGLLLLLVGLVAVAPWVLAKTSLRNELFSTLVNDPNVQVVSDDASFGFFSPLSIRGMNVDANQGQITAEIREIEAERSWLAMLFSRPQLGSFTIVHPVIDLTLAELPETPREPRQSGQSLPMLIAIIENASITVREPKSGNPAIALADVNVTFRLDRDEQESVLSVDPAMVFDHMELTPEICNHGLQLIAPLLAEQIDVDGAFSFQLDRFRIPLNPGNDGNQIKVMELAGVIQLHHGSVGMKDSIADQVTKKIGRLLGADLPDRLRVVEETEIKFQFADGKVHHEGFAMVLPHRQRSIELVSSGSVSLDNQIDLKIEVDLPIEILGNPDLTKLLDGAPIEIQVTGSIKQPVIKLAPNSELTRRFQSLLHPANVGKEASKLIEQTTDVLGDLLPKRPDPEDRIVPKMLDRFRKRFQQRRE